MKNKQLNLQVHRNGSDLVSLKNEWKDLLAESATNTIFQTWEWNHLWWKHFGPSDGFFLITVRDAEGDLLGIAPFFLNSDGNEQKSIEFIGGIDLSDYLDFIVFEGKGSSFYSAVVDFLNSHRDLWDKIDLHCLPAASPTLKRFRSLCQQRGFRETLTVEDVCPRVNLPSSWDEFLAGMSKKERHEIRRKINKIQREAEDCKYITVDPESFSENIESFIELHQKSNADKMVFMNMKRRRFFKEMAWTFLQKGWLQLLFLEANHTMLASLLNFSYGDTVYVYNSGYDPEFSHWSPGWVLISHSIQDAIKRGVENYDFLRGNESYKYRFRGKDSEIYRYTIQR